jgi:hypothetical protein
VDTKNMKKYKNKNKIQKLNKQGRPTQVAISKPTAET